MTAPLVLLPNVSALTTAFLRAQSEVSALVADRVVTAFAKSQVFPAVKVEEFSDRPIVERPLWLVAADLQISAFGGPKALAHKIAETCRAALAARFEGTQSYTVDTNPIAGVVTHCRVSGLRDEPDKTYTPAKPRWLFIATVYAHPAP